MIGICGGGFDGIDVGPYQRQFGIQFDKGLLSFWHCIVLENGISWAFWFAETAINTNGWANGKEIGAFKKGIDRTDGDTVSVFTFDAIISDDECHVELQKQRVQNRNSDCWFSRANCTDQTQKYKSAAAICRLM
jgi:hypothetical protein